MYNPMFGTFITHVSELGFALHEMFKVFLLLMGDLSYEEIVLTIKELQ